METVLMSVIILIALIQSIRVIKLREKLAKADKAFKDLCKEYNVQEEAYRP
jgi:hypothetical protein